MKAVSIGELAVDWLSLERGESMMTAREFYRYLGGNASNVAVGLARLGLESCIISKVGADIHGDYLLACLEREHVDVSFVVQDKELPTAQCYMTRREDGFPDYYAWPSPNASKCLRPEDVTQECLDNSWIWHLAAVSFLAKPRRFAMQYAIEQASLRKKLISFDACFPLVESDGGRIAAWQAMHKADIIKFNQAEIAYWSGLSEGSSIEDMVAKVLLDLKPALLVVTLAEKGAYLFSGGKSIFCPPYPVQSIGDVGPGDAFSAGLIYGLSTLKEAGRDKNSLYKLDLDSWLRLARYGACAGALVTRAHSATEKFPRLDELEACLGETSTRS